MKSYLLKSTLSCLLVVFSSSAQSAPVTFTFQSSLAFDQTLVMNANGQTAGDVIDGIYGAGTGATGKISLSGSLTYDNNTPVFQQASEANGGGVVSDFLEPITALQLNIGGISVDANIAMINANSGSSTLGVGLAIVDGAPESCFGDFTLCTAAKPELPMTRSSNLALMQDAKPPIGTGPDFIGFGLGFTGVENDFSPVFNTGASNINKVFVDGFLMFLQGNPSTDLWDEFTSLPANNSPFDPANFGIDPAGRPFQVGIAFNGAGISGFEATGVLSSVPIPSAVWLFGSGLIGLFGAARHKRSWKARKGGGTL